MQRVNIQHYLINWKILYTVLHIQLQMMNRGFQELKKACTVKVKIINLFLKELQA